MSEKTVKGHLERQGKERDGSWQKKGDVYRFACIKSRRLRASSQYRHTHIHTHTEMHTQMHSDNPSALAKCCLIQPDLHSTEKANSLPLTVWKTERSSHKWQRFKLLCLCGVCVCACVFVPGGMLTQKQCTAHVFIFVMIFFSAFVHVRLHVLVVTGSSAVPPSSWQADSWAVLLPIVWGLSSNPACTASYTACVRVCVCWWESVRQRVYTFYFATSTSLR